ncbi:hypothetical protein [Aidingimonas halophila]|uniref:Uncharacterized protein n=1 Tax=Aidingimonas halophila TaxID=574349 RepID=A0A1H3EL94_9GAMM|nr:hypothetical protein [Aidingimonas halophila]GHC31348.1 hypothetical protein GCM10008094_24710 [Aidingimonas halophila]SDX79563.1 hypothetical protein SAMN05443545_107170 [Aidingimonas halophila]
MARLRDATAGRIPACLTEALTRPDLTGHDARVTMQIRDADDPIVTAAPQ